MGARAVSRAAGHLDLAPYESPVRDHQLELGGLGHDRAVGMDRAQRLLHAEARVLLVGHRRHHHVAGQPEAGRLAAAVSAAASPAFMS